MGFVSSTTFYQSKDGPSPCLETHRINLNINLFEVSRQRFALLPSITQCRIAETPHMSTRRISATLTHAHARTHTRTHARTRTNTHTLTVHTHTHTRARVHTNALTCVRVRVRVCLRVHVRTCVYVRVWVRVHEWCDVL